MRGLKPSRKVNLYWAILVASFTDAWIETRLLHNYQKVIIVASFTDAWIETIDYDEDASGNEKSHLLQMRGLKQRGIMKRLRQ